MSKVTVIGAGNVGATCANVLAHKDLVKEVVLLDIMGDVARGKALDTWQQAPIISVCLYSPIAALYFAPKSVIYASKLPFLGQNMPCSRTLKSRHSTKWTDTNYPSASPIRRMASVSFSSEVA
jgi:2-polyprenyl-6-methoxyphenol hydroxylase-like FAD-dependent oxidoreductase